MKTTMKFLLLLLHFFVSAIIIYYVGDIMSQNIDMGTLLFLGLSISLVMVSIIKHTTNFLFFIKNKNQQL